MSDVISVIGEPIQVEIGGKRFYRVDFSDGAFRHLRSVTTIVKGATLPSFLDEWKLQQVEALGIEGYKAALKQAADDGTDLHKLIENHVAGQEFEVDDEDIKRMYENYLRWEEKRNPKYHWMEKTLYSLRYGYAGRCDGLVEVNGRLPIIDFKSAKRTQEDHKEQGAAYLMAAGEMGILPDSVLILALGADNKQGFTETWLDNPYDIHRYFMGFQLKNNLVSYHNTVHV